MTDLESRLSPRCRAIKRRMDARNVPTILSLRFGNLDTLEGLTPAANRMTEAAARARDLYLAIYEDHWASMADPLATEPARLVRSASSARRRIKEAQKTHEAALKAAEAEAGDLHKQLDAASRPPTDTGNTSIDAEYRALLRSEKDASRALTLARKHPRAVATAPVELTGLAPEVYSTIRGEYLRTVAPYVCAQRDSLMAAINAAHTAMDSLEKDTREFIDFDRAAQYESQEFHGGAE